MCWARPLAIGLKTHTQRAVDDDDRANKCYARKQDLERIQKVASHVWKKMFRHGLKMSDASCLAMYDDPLRKYACHELKKEENLSAENVCRLLCPHQDRQHCLKAYKDVAESHRDLCRTQWKSVYATSDMTTTRAATPQ